MIEPEKIRKHAAVPYKSSFNSVSYWQRIKTFINNGIYKLDMKFREFSELYEVKEKTLTLLSWLFDISITGLAIWICIEYRNFFSYGLTAALALYYLDKVMKIIKTPITKNDIERK